MACSRKLRPAAMESTLLFGSTRAWICIKSRTIRIVRCQSWIQTSSQKYFAARFQPIEPNTSTSSMIGMIANDQASRNAIIMFIVSKTMAAEPRLFSSRWISASLSAAVADSPPPCPLNCAEADDSASSQTIDLI